MPHSYHIAIFHLLIPLSPEPHHISAPPVTFFWFASFHILKLIISKQGCKGPFALGEGPASLSGNNLGRFIYLTHDAIYQEYLYLGFYK